MARRHVQWLQCFVFFVSSAIDSTSSCLYALTPPMNSRNQWQPTFSFSFSFFQQPRRILTRQPGNLLSVETDWHPFIFIFWVPPCTAVITFTVWPTISRSRPQLQKEKRSFDSRIEFAQRSTWPAGPFKFLLFFFPILRIVRFLFESDTSEIATVHIRQEELDFLSKNFKKNSGISQQTQAGCCVHWLRFFFSLPNGRV
jgi:hypothetical protein